MKPIAFYALLTALLLTHARAIEVRQVELRTAEVDIPLYIARPDGPGPFPASAVHPCQTRQRRG